MTKSLIQRWFLSLAVFCLVITASGCESLNALEKDLGSSNPETVSGSVLKLRKLATENTKNGTAFTETQEAALKLMIQSIGSVPQCKQEFLDILFKRGYYSGFDLSLGCSAIANMKESDIDDDILDALAVNGYFTNLYLENVQGYLQKYQIPAQYAELLKNASVQRTVSSGSHAMGRIIVFSRKYNTQKADYDEAYTLDCLTFFMPKEHRISIADPGVADVLIKREHVKALVGSYDNGAKAYRIDTVLNFFEVKSGEMFLSHTFTGEEPPKVINGSSRAGNGSVTDEGTIIEYLQKLGFAA